MLRDKAACALLALLALPALAETPRHESLVALDQLMIARSVASQCAQIEAPTAAFQRQYRQVAEQAALSLKALSTDLTRDRIEKVISDHYGEIDRRVNAMIAQESCDGSHIKEALQKYDSVANLSDTRLLAITNNR